MLAGLRDNGYNGASDTRGGRWPGNVMLDGEAAAELDRQSGETGGGKLSRNSESGRSAISTRAHNPRQPNRTDSICNYGDTGGASRFFYRAKAPRWERDYGLPAGDRCQHPCVKPVALLRWLCKLVTPPGGVVLDPFMGSGSCGIAAKLEGFDYIGIELDAEYVAIAEARIAAWQPGSKQDDKTRPGSGEKPEWHLAGNSDNGTWNSQTCGFVKPKPPAECEQLTLEEM